jgi:hypothetical protein
MPIVDDPFDFGAIAATNAISDVYAMGGTPLFALALVGMPVNQLPVDTIRKILAGGESVCAKAGIPIAGGHTIDSVEPIYGLVAIGLVDPKNLKRNAGARPGDQLILGKPLGVGVYSAALKKEKLSAEGYAAMIASTTQLNTPGIALGHLASVHALTDVTGFGLLGPPARNLPRVERRRHDRLCANTAASGRARARACRPLHWRLRPQLGRVRPRCRARRRRRRYGAGRAHRSADVGRAARRLRARRRQRRARHFSQRRLRGCRGDR